MVEFFRGVAWLLIIAILGIVLWKYAHTFCIGLSCF